MCGVGSELDQEFQVSYSDASVWLVLVAFVGWVGLVEVEIEYGYGKDIVLS